jgi:RNA polymerase sigma factor (sigma-70 family)
MWDRYASLVRRILGPVDAEDGVQDAFLRLFRDLDSLRDPAGLRSFLVGITLHVAKSELRRRRARRWLLLSDDGVDAEPEATASDEWNEPRAAVLCLYQVLDRVSYERRTVFVLRDIEGLDLAELSAVLLSRHHQEARGRRGSTRLSSGRGGPAARPYVKTNPAGGACLCKKNSDCSTGYGSNVSSQCSAGMCSGTTTSGMYDSIDCQTVVSTP